MQEITVCTFSIQLGQIRLQPPAGSQKNGIVTQLDRKSGDGDFLQITGPLETLETALGRSWRKLQVILRRGRPTSNIFGANAHTCERAEMYFFNGLQIQLHTAHVQYCSEKKCTCHAKKLNSVLVRNKHIIAVLAGVGCK